MVNTLTYVFSLTCLLQNYNIVLTQPSIMGFMSILDTYAFYFTPMQKVNGTFETPDLNAGDWNS